MRASQPNPSPTATSLGESLMGERATVLLADDIAGIEDGTMILQVGSGFWGPTAT